jgi:hypothetical protein
MTNINLSDFITIGALEWFSVANNYTASSGDAIIADTGAGTFTITLPATPTEGDYIIILDGDDWSTTNLTVARNGSTIDSLAENLIVDVGKIKIANIPLTIFGIVVVAVALKFVPNCSAAVVTKIAQNPVPKPSPAQTKYIVFALAFHKMVKYKARNNMVMP